MTMDAKSLRLFLAVSAFSVAIFLLRLWQPTQQVRLHQRHLLRAVEKRKWQAVNRFIATDYRDRWMHDKENVLRETAQVFGQFFVCSIQCEERTLSVRKGIGVVTAQLILGGTGSPIAEYAKERVNTLTEPFTFKWQRRSWKPWDWALVEADQPQLEIETRF